VTNLAGSFREALAADLALEFPDADVFQGIRVGKAVDRAKLCVFWAGSQEVSATVVVGEARVVVRYWPVSAKVRDDQTGGVRDPGELEQAAWDLQTFLQTKQTSYGASGAWFCRLQSVTPDYDPEEWGVEATLLLQFDNPAVIA
jgi:hypothetical protein